MTFRILVVCSANACRSPLAAALLAAAFDRADVEGVEISSAGTAAVPGGPPCARVLEASRHLDLDVFRMVHHRARELTSAQVRAADLVLAADRSGRAAVARLAPGTSTRHFTLREAAELAQAVSPPPEREVLGDLEDRLASFVHALHGQRGMTPQPRVGRMRSRFRPWQSTIVHSHDVPDAHVERPGLHPGVIDLLSTSTAQLNRRLLCWSGVADPLRP